MLNEGQDPDSLEARVAYHLHRLKFVGEPLRNARFVPARYLGDLTKGRMPLTAGDLAELARGLDVGVEELSRPLTEGEKMEWAFYRSSARHANEVWRRALKAWTAAGLSNRQVAAILQMPHQKLHQCLVPSPEVPHAALSYPAACRLAAALDLADPSVFVNDLAPEQVTGR